MLHLIHYKCNFSKGVPNDVVPKRLASSAACGTSQVSEFDSIHNHRISLPYSYPLSASIL